LSSVYLGRLVTVVSGEPDVFPVNFVVQRHTIVVRTAEGSKLAGVQINPRVAFEADDHDGEKGWSVVVKGYAHVVSQSDDMARAECAQVLPWTATEKHRYIRIRPTEISGRRFRFGAESRKG
jgi:nitroimidazol reductase NimA-like FMN-containing flavoprotein (pyridoxamine 5'-phosphate oxidase superfamily)